MPPVGTVDQTYAIVTPTYRGDLLRCELLAESLDRCGTDVPHYLIVDRRDYPIFKHLRGKRREIIESEALVGKWLWRIPGDSGYWLGKSILPVRGWILQQLLKLSASGALTERTLVFCDSDVAFIRPFTRRDLMVGDKVGLLDIPDNSGNVMNWSNVASQLLGLNGPIAMRNHVGNMICWNRETIAALQSHVESITGLHWPVAIARCPTFSEYILYGIYVRQIAGYAHVDHEPSDVPLVEGSWGVDLSSEGRLAQFFERFDDRTVAVMVHSKDGTDPRRLRPHLERYWREVS